MSCSVCVDAIGPCGSFHEDLGRSLHVLRKVGAKHGVRNGIELVIHQIGDRVDGLLHAFEVIVQVVLARLAKQRERLFRVLMAEARKQRSSHDGDNKQSCPKGQNGQKCNFGTEGT